MGVPVQKLTGGAAAGTLFSIYSSSYQRSTASCVQIFVLLWVLGFAGWAIWATWIYPLWVSPLRNLPQPPGSHWLLGQSQKIMTQPLGLPMREWVRTVPHDGLIRYLGMFNQERLMVCSPKALAEVLVTNTYSFAKPYQLRWSIGRILGVGLLLAEGHEHKMQRRKLLPAFHFRHINNLYPLFWTKAREITQTMAAEMTQAARGSPGKTQTQPQTQQQQQEVFEVEISRYASLVTLDVIGIAAMGRDFGAVKDPNGIVVKTYEQIFEPSRTDEVMSLVGRFIPFKFIAALPLPRNLFIKQAADDLRQVCRDIIRDKKAKMARKEQLDVDILSVALQSGGFSTDESLVDELMTFLTAGHETTASALTWAIYLLARFPDVQSRLRQEIHDMLPPIDSEQGITSADVQRLPYLAATCNEVLRYYGPLPMASRHATHDTTIQGQPVPKGTRVVFVPWATNFDPSLWGPDAHLFRPERWLAMPPTSSSTTIPDNDSDADSDHDKASRKAAASGGSSSNFAFLTFSHGPRGCIGQSFSRGEFSCLLAAWIGKFEFELADPRLMDESLIKVRRGITVRPKELRVKVKIIS